MLFWGHDGIGRKKSVFVTHSVTHSVTHFVTQLCLETRCHPFVTHSKWIKLGQTISKGKALKSSDSRAFGKILCRKSSNLALGELRSATGGFEAVLLLAKNEKPVGIPYFFGCPNSG